NVSFSFIRRTSPTNAVLQPGTTIITGTYTSVDVPPQMQYYRIRAHFLPFVPCTQFDLYSPSAPICGAVGTVTPGLTSPTDTPAITPTAPPLTPTSTRTATTTTLTGTRTVTPPAATATSTASRTPVGTATPPRGCIPAWNLVYSPNSGSSRSNT